MPNTSQELASKVVPIFLTAVWLTVSFTTTPSRDSVFQAVYRARAALWPSSHSMRAGAHYFVPDMPTLLLTWGSSFWCRNGSQLEDGAIIQVGNAVHLFSPGKIKILPTGFPALGLRAIAILACSAKSGEGANFPPACCWLTHPRNPSLTANSKDHLITSTHRKCRPETGAPTNIFLGAAVQTPALLVLAATASFGR